MNIATGKVVDGRVVVEGGVLEEGATVTVLAHEADAGFELSEEQEPELLQSIGEAERGEVISGDEFLRTLRSRS